MGYEQIKAAGYYLHGEEGEFSFESFPLTGEVTTYSTDSTITDSAASATATGKKVNNGVISKALHGDGEDLLTILEYAQLLGMSSGLATTTALTHATPAAFGAHVDLRSDYQTIANCYFEQTVLPF